MRSTLPLLLFACLVQASPRLIVKLDPSTGTASRDGRLIVIVSKEMNGEPRSQVTWGVQTQQIFGQEVDAWKPGSTVEMAADTPGDPLHTLADLPSGSYNVQAVLNVYQTFHRADGHVLKVHPDHGEGQRWHRPGTCIASLSTST